MCLTNVRKVIFFCWAESFSLNSATNQFLFTQLNHDLQSWIINSNHTGKNLLFFTQRSDFLRPPGWVFVVLFEILWCKYWFFHWFLPMKYYVKKKKNKLNQLKKNVLLMFPLSKLFQNQVVLIWVGKNKYCSKIVLNFILCSTVFALCGLILVMRFREPHVLLSFLVG